MAFLLSAVFSVLKGYTCVLAWVVAAVAGGVATILGIVVGFSQVSWVVVKWVTVVLGKAGIAVDFYQVSWVVV